MRRYLRRHIPSMFHRRLLLLFVAAIAVTAVLGAQTARLTTGQAHHEAVEQVNEALKSTRLIPTVRGRILDRWGRVLAEDEPGYDVAVSYPVISGEWAYDQARRAARRAYRSRWSQMSPEERDAAIAEHQGPYDQQVQMLWQMLADLGQVDRSEIERRKSVITQRVQNVASHLWLAWRKKRAAELGEPVPLADVAQPIGEQRQAHSILTDIPESVRMTVLGFIAEAEHDPALRIWREVEVQRPRQRRYPLDEITVVLDRSHLPEAIRSDEPVEITVGGVARHILGMMRDVWEQDVSGPDGRPFRRTTPDGRRIADLGGYLPGDSVGSFGIERAMERVLRGTRGRVVRYLDTGHEDRLEPEPGRDVQLTLDIQLQARIQAIMQPEFGLMVSQPWHANDQMPVGTPLNGAALVMAVDSGEVLAMVTVPGYSLAEWEEDAQAIVEHPDQPLINRPIAAVYAPGSTLKPIVYCLAAAERAIAPDQHFVCEGVLLPEKPNMWRCWGYRPNEGLYHTHGDTDPIEAIAVSCNIYFYRCGRVLGPERLVRGLMRWGFGAPTGLALDEEIAGLLPSLEGDNRPGRALNLANATNMGIGQGPIAVPPIQIAAAHAAIARGGVWLSPKVVREPALEQTRRDLRVPGPVIDRAQRGMYESANNPRIGTAHHLPGREPIMNAPDVDVRAKTGTAEAPVQFEDTNDNGKLDPGEPIVRRGTHSWYVAHVSKAGERRTRYIVCVLVEYGGSGGRVSGPIANQIIHALQVEGYL